MLVEPLIRQVCMTSLSSGHHEEPLAHHSAAELSTAALKSAQISVIAMGLSKRMGLGQAQICPTLEPGADAVAPPTSGLVAGEPPGDRSALFASGEELAGAN